jgi:tetratricopeptide (TPR) repeat protein
MDRFPRGRAAALLSLALLAATAAAYAGALRLPFVEVLDDGAYVTWNPVVRGGLTADGARWAFSTFAVANWHPLAWLSHMADVELFGVDPSMHHLVSAAFHGANGVLLFLLLLRATGRLAPSFLAAALFLLHPTRVEAAAWVSERKELLAAFFGFLAAHAYLSWTEKGGAGRYAALLLAFALSLLSKPTLVTLPLLLLLLDFWPLGRLGGGEGSGPADGRPSGGAFLPVRRLLLEKAPLLLLSACSSLVTLAAQGRGGTVSGFDAVAPAARVSNAFVSAASYLGKALLPVSLSPVYLHPSLGGGGGPSSWKAAGAALLLAGITAGAFRLRRTAPWLLAGWGWFLLSLLPVIGLVQVGLQGMADRYAYIPFAGLFAAAAFSADALAGRGAGWRKGTTAAAAVLLVALSAATVRQLRYWEGGEALFGQALRVDPGNWAARYYLGGVYELEGRADKAEEQYEAVVRMQPGSPLGLAALGVLAEGRGDRAGAERLYGAALERDPGHPAAAAGMGNALAARGDRAGAERWYLRALAGDGGNFRVRSNLARVLLLQGRKEEAIAQYREALSSSLGDEQVRRNLEAALAAPPPGPSR